MSKFQVGFSSNQILAYETRLFKFRILSRIMEWWQVNFSESVVAERLKSALRQ